MSSSGSWGLQAVAALALIVLAATPQATAKTKAHKPSVQPQAESSAGGLADAMLRTHNTVRAKVGAPPVTWDKSLAQQAAGWAENNLRLGRLQHSSAEQRHGAGENLAGIFGAHLSPDALAAGWVRERDAYTHGPIDCEGNWAATGHYTQMVWSNTKRIGCGVASDATGEVLVCRYAPTGNVCGERPY